MFYAAWPKISYGVVFSTIKQLKPVLSICKSWGFLPKDASNYLLSLKDSIRRSALFTWNKTSVKVLGKVGEGYAQLATEAFWRCHPIKLNSITWAGEESSLCWTIFTILCILSLHFNIAKQEATVSFESLLLSTLYITIKFLIPVWL